jgi:hypothetical protein
MCLVLVVSHKYCFESSRVINKLSLKIKRHQSGKIGPKTELITGNESDGSLWK